MNGESTPASFETSEHFNKNGYYTSANGSLFHSVISLNDLFHIILKKIHPLFSIDCSVIMEYDDQVTVIREAFISKYSGDSETLNTDHVSQPSELSSLQKVVSEFTFPVIKTM